MDIGLQDYLSSFPANSNHPGFREAGRIPRIRAFLERVIGSPPRRGSGIVQIAIDKNRDLVKMRVARSEATRNFAGLRLILYDHHGYNQPFI